MAPFLRVNFSEGLLATDISEASPTITVQNGHTFPIDVGAFRLTLYSPLYRTNPVEDPNLEVVTASYSGTPNIYNIIRAQEATTAHPHMYGDVVAMFYTAGVSTDDLTWLGSYQVDEIGAAANKVLNLSDGKITYTDSPTLKDIALTAPSAIYGLSHDSFADFSANKHVDHTTISITGADGCGGGGNISASQIISNIDKGSAAVFAHNLAYNHLLLHAATTVTAAPLTISGQQLTFTYDTSDFQLLEDALQIKDGGIDHGGISGLADDDHTQYIQVTGTRAKTDCLFLGNPAIKHTIAGVFVDASNYGHFLTPLGGAFGAGSYYDDGWKNYVTGGASQWAVFQTKIGWSCAPSGAVDAATSFTERFSIDLNADNSISFLTVGGGLGINTATPVFFNEGMELAVIAPGTGTTNLDLGTTTVVVSGQGVGGINFLGLSQGTHKRLALISGTSDGATNNERGGKLVFYTKPDASTSITERMSIDATGLMTMAGVCRANGGFNDNGNAGLDDTAAGTIVDVHASGGLVTAVTRVTPAADGTYANPTSITIANGIITAIL